MNRYGHIFPATDAALSDALDATHAAVARPANVVELRAEGADA